MGCERGLRLPGQEVREEMQRLNPGHCLRLPSSQRGQELGRGAEEEHWRGGGTVSGAAEPGLREMGSWSQT